MDRFFFNTKSFNIPKIAKFLKNGPIFQENPYKWPFSAKITFKMDRGFEARAAHPYPTQIWVPLPGLFPKHPGPKHGFYFKGVLHYYPKIYSFRSY